MRGCIYRTKDNECDRYSEGGKYFAFCDEDCDKAVPSNADRIRAMTDEDLAKWIAARYPDCPPGISPGPFGCAGECAVCWLRWLRKETDE